MEEDKSVSESEENLKVDLDVEKITEEPEKTSEDVPASPEKAPAVSEPVVVAPAAGEKFKGVLSKMGSSSESSEHESEPKLQFKKNILKLIKDRPARRPRQRVSTFVREPLPPPSTFVMKLFDRSVDLTRFTLDSPLYPICRAWFQNNPKILTKKELRRRDEKANQSRDCYSLPAPLEATGELAPLPPLQPYPMEKGFDINYDPEEKILASREQLLNDHLSNWMKVKSHYRSQAARREGRYKPSLDILRDLYLSLLH